MPAIPAALTATASTTAAATLSPSAPCAAPAPAAAPPDADDPSGRAKVFADTPSQTESLSASGAGNEREAGEDRRRRGRSLLLLAARLTLVEVARDQRAGLTRRRGRTVIGEQRVEVLAFAPAAPHEERRRDRLLERVAQAREARVHGAALEPERVCELRRLESLAQMKVEEPVLLRSERGRGAPHQLDQFAVARDGLGIGEPARIDLREDDSFRFLAGRKPRAPAQLVHRAVVRNRIEPCLHGGHAPIAKRLPRVDEGRLHDIGRRLTVPDKPEHEVVDPLEVALVKLGERVFVPGGRPRPAARPPIGGPRW